MIALRLFNPFRPADTCSKCITARITIPPLPVVYSFRAPDLPIIHASVGKSGPGIICINCVSVISKLPPSLLMLLRPFVIATHASISSPKLCGGTFVAMPTAMPAAPFNNNTGTFAGKTLGSYSFPSKFGKKSTVSRLISSSNVSAAIRVKRHSVYRIAAAGSASMEPKFPCPSTNGMFVENVCAKRTRAS